VKPLLAGAAAVAIGAVVGLLVLARGDGEIEPIVFTGRPLAVQTAVDSRSHLFGDRIVMQLELLLDRRVVVPESVRVTTAFEPYQAAGATVRERTDAGDLVRMRFAWPLECVSQECAPGTGGTTRFPLSRVDYLMRAGGRNADVVEWPAVQARRGSARRGSRTRAGAPTRGRCRSRRTGSRPGCSPPGR
jgi:hypothetical protein